MKKLITICLAAFLCSANAYAQTAGANVAAAPPATSTGSAVPAAPVPKPDINIVLAGPFSGALASWGEKAKAGAELAVDAINEKGGILGQKIKLSVEDDACDPQQAVSVANKIVQEKAAAVIGHLCSGAEIAASDIYADAGVLSITPTASNPAVTDNAKGFVFRTWDRDDVQGKFLAEFLAKRYKGKRIAIINDKSTYGLGLAKEVSLNLTKLNAKEVIFDNINAGEKDYSALVSKLKHARINVLVFAGFPSEGGLILRQLKEQKTKIQMIGGDAFFSNDIASIAGDAVNGTIFSFLQDPNSKSDNANLIERMKQKNVAPDAVTFAGYVAVQVWAQAVEKAGVFYAQAVGAALRANSFDTVFGAMTFDQKGDWNEAQLAMYQWNDGKYAPYTAPVKTIAKKSKTTKRRK